MNSLGRFGEDEASLFLEKGGFILLERNFTLHRSGEIDIICRMKKRIVFVEVKTRRRTSKGSAEESITEFKKRRMLHTAKWWIMMHPEYSEFDFRFDLIAVSFKEGTVQISHIENIIEDTLF